MNVDENEEIKKSFFEEMRPYIYPNKEEALKEFISVRIDDLWGVVILNKCLKNFFF